jgi:hypothetical protein
MVKKYRNKGAKFLNAKKNRNIIRKSTFSTVTRLLFDTEDAILCVKYFNGKKKYKAARKLIEYLQFKINQIGDACNQCNTILGFFKIRNKLSPQSNDVEDENIILKYLREQNKISDFYSKSKLDLFCYENEI